MEKKQLTKDELQKQTSEITEQIQTHAKETDKLKKKMEKLLFEYAKNEFRGKCLRSISTGDIIKVIEVREVCVKTDLRYTVWCVCDLISSEKNQLTFNRKEINRNVSGSFGLKNDGELDYWEITDDAIFTQTNILNDSMRDMDGMIIRKYLNVCFNEGEKIVIGAVEDFDESNNYKIKVCDAKTQSVRYVFKKGNELKLLR